jgi:Histidine kinase-, DNA gyrase B-, and HSP90-like ATPase
VDEANVEVLAEPVLAGQHVLVAVSDTGTGMDKTTMEKVFEPFFTAKEAGKGTWLGLSQVYGFVRQSNGHVRIYSELGEGTTIKIYLPRLIGSDGEPAEMPAKSPAMLRGAGETILVVKTSPIYERTPPRHCGISDTVSSRLATLARRWRYLSSILRSNSFLLMSF